ncbi:MAG: glycerol-3-phosphate acyltransferase [Chloroflexi bacterium]|nr:glycerol-3-phosphate acyltransferase [Chloroflexota bacterium]
MPWLIILLAYLIGSVPTAYIVGRGTRGVDIREVGDENMGAANAFRELGPRAGVTVFFIDLAKGALCLLLARVLGAGLEVALLAGAAAVAGHNWPVFAGFRGGRGLSTAIGALLVALPQPVLILAVPALLALAVKKNVSLAAGVLFAPLWLVSWITGAPPVLLAYSIAMPLLVGFTHFVRTRKKLPHRV